MTAVFLLYLITVEHSYRSRLLRAFNDVGNVGKAMTVQRIDVNDVLGDKICENILEQGRFEGHLILMNLVTGTRTLS